MTHVVIAGARGLVGAHLVEAFRSRPGMSVVATAHRPGEADRMLDIADRAAVARFLDQTPVDVFVCAAALPGVEDCEHDPAGSRPVNVDGPLDLAVRLAARGARLVVYSTEYVFDGRRGGAYEEHDAVAPLNAYGRQKLELERGVCAHPGHLAVRTSGVYGPDERRKNFVLQMLDAAGRGEHFRVPDDQLITPTLARSLAELTLQAVERQLSGVLHLAGAEVLARVAFAREVCDVFGLDPGMIEPTPTDQLGLAAVRPLGAGLSVAGARALGLGPFVAPREGLTELREALAGSRRDAS